MLGDIGDRQRATWPDWAPSPHADTPPDRVDGLGFGPAKAYWDSFFTVLGGFGTFAGPIVGAIVFNYLKTFAVGYTVYWQMFLGVVLVTMVMALPTGIMGMVGRLSQKWSEKSSQTSRKAPAS